MLLTALLWVLPAAVLADKDEEEGADSAEEGKAGEADPWEAPPEDEEAPPGAPVEAPKESMRGDGRPLQLGLAIGYGFETEKSKYGSDPYGFGAGLRAGYTLDMGVFVGFASTYFLGSTQGDDNIGGVVRPAVENSVSALMIGFELGYDVWLGPVIFRPSAELGVLLTFSSYDVRTGLASTRGGMYISPGATVLVPIGEFYLGGDGRLPLAVGEGQSTFTIMAIGGLRFDTKLF